ncbi:MAG TPA: hypothetical protein VEW64_07370 [Methyloceanibacter sp.]|nr:hypothetical protein [Methyloceanibacter sp.]
MQPHLPPACHPDREAPLVAVPRLALPPEPACLAGRTVVLSARELRRLAAEAQGVRRLAAEAQGVRRLVAEARALQRAAQAWQAWPAQAS